MRGRPVAQAAPAPPGLADAGPPLTPMQLLAEADALLMRTMRAPAAHADVADVADADRLLVLAQLAGALVEPDDPAVVAALARGRARDPQRTARAIAALGRLCNQLGRAPTNADLDAAEAH